MNSSKRPLSIWIVACAYLAVGSIGFVYHLPELLASRRNSILVELVELLAVLTGVFLLRRHNWARWLALAWMGFHVVITVHEPLPLAIHCLLFAVIAWVLFRSDALPYFRGAGAPM